jgi:hypothetical protein
MAILNGIIRTTGSTPGSGSTSFGRITAPANQKVIVWVKMLFKDTASSPGFHAIELRRAVTGGTLNTATPLVKMNAQDTETIRSAFATYSVQPTHSSGSLLFGASVRGDRAFAFQRVVLNQNETLDVISNTSPGAVGYELEISIEE